MKLLDRLKKIEAKAPPEQIIHVVKYQTELNTLEYGEDEYLRLDGETEDEFIERILAIVKKSPHPNGCYLVGNIY
jgi:hypothetical protein